MPDVKLNTAKQKAQPATVVKPSEKVRNRENQRRLRERRKGYTEELERKLQALEREGVHASEVMQKAARIVVGENRLLRQLLSSHGVSSTAIDDFMRTTTTSANTSSPTMQHAPPATVKPPPLSSDQTSERLEAASHQRRASLQSQAELPALKEISASDYAQAGVSIALPLYSSGIAVSQRDSTPPPPSAWGSDVSYAGTTNTLGMTASPARPASLEPRRRTCIDGMDCEEAARIITHWRGGQDPRDAWPELGCSHANRTTVKNADLMSLAG